MLLFSQQLRWLRSVVPILLLLLTEGRSYPTATTRLRCYVCGGENAESCGDLTSTPPETSLKLCPETARGCLTQAEDKEVTRSCVDLKITDCKAANGKVYCYCDTDACNDTPASIGRHSEDEDEDDLVHRHQLANSTSEWQADLDNLEKRRQKICETDDEDLCDGSGSQSEDSPNDHLIEAIANVNINRPSTTTTTEKATTKEDATISRSIEETTRSSDKTLILKEAGTTPNSKKEPSRGCAFKSFLPLLITAIVSVLFGNVWLLRN